VAPNGTTSFKVFLSNDYLETSFTTESAATLTESTPAVTEESATTAAESTATVATESTIEVAVSEEPQEASAQTPATIARVNNFFIIDIKFRF
jgi:hypothetical protein